MAEPDANVIMDGALFSAYLALVEHLHKKGIIDARELAKQMAASDDFAQAGFRMGPDQLQLRRALSSALAQLADALHGDVP